MLSRRSPTSSSTGYETNSGPSSSSRTITVCGAGYSSKYLRRKVVHERTLPRPATAAHSASSERHLSHVGPGGKRNLPQSEHFWSRSSFFCVYAQNCSAYGSIERMGRGVAIALAPFRINDALALACDVVHVLPDFRAFDLPRT